MRRALFVFSHPNHELAVLGHLLRWRPHLLYLTDGGADARVQETVRVLEDHGLDARATFLREPEARVYEALREGDAAYVHDLAAKVQRHASTLAPANVACDAVEYYNPSHDLSRPLVMHALGARTDVTTWEIPLVRQHREDPEGYTLQRFSPRAAVSPQALHLDDREVAIKRQARASSYPSLVREMGGVLDAVPEDHLRTEWVGRITGPALEPGEDTILRYEWRGRLLHAQGAVPAPITWKDHVLPIVGSLAVPS